MHKYLFDQKKYYSQIHTFSSKWTVTKLSLDFVASRLGAVSIYICICLNEVWWERHTNKYIIINENKSNIIKEMKNEIITFKLMIKYTKGTINYN